MRAYDSHYIFPYELWYVSHFHLRVSLGFYQFGVIFGGYTHGPFLVGRIDRSLVVSSPY